MAQKIQRYDQQQAGIAGTIPAMPSYYDKEETYVTQAPEAPVDKETTRLILSFGQIPLVCLTVAFVIFTWDKFDTRVMAGLALMLFSAMNYALWRFTLLVATGKFLKNKEMQQKSKLEQQRMASVEKMDTNRLHLADRFMTLQAENEKLRIKQETALTEMRQELAIAKSSRASAIMAMNNDPATQTGHVSANVSQERTALLNWIFGGINDDGLYRWDGQINEEKVDPRTGKLLSTTQMPWRQGICNQNSPTWKEVYKPSGWPETFRFEKSMGNAWLLNIGDYPEAHMIEKAVGLY